MKAADRWLRAWRFSKAKPFVSESLLDVGCHDGEFLRSFVHLPRLGVDSKLPRPSHKLCRETSLSELKLDRKFQTISCLATFEHFPPAEKAQFWRLAQNHLEDDGRIVMTVPHPLVDRILRMAKAFGILDGMEDHQHTHVDSATVVTEARAHGFELDIKEKFQLGLNRLFVFKFSSGSASCSR